MKLKLALVFIAALTLTSFAEDKVDFEKQILPIIKESCIKCHKAPYKDKRGRMKKPKGGLRLDTKALILAGAKKKNGDVVQVIKPGNPDESSFYTLTILPEDDEDVMPAKGDLLTKEQQELIKNWIKQGANFGNWTEMKE